MKTWTTTAKAAVLGILVMTSAAHADAQKGIKLYQKNLKETCGMSGAVFAAKFKQAEWDKAYKAGKLSQKMTEACPKGKAFFEGDKYKKVEEHLYDFVHEYAKDSGNIPSC
ncbi:cytochrome C [Sulfuricurvum sp. IAE1]|jgi:hypothetical protein|uniref:cytochrome C n=1 Tax=Sulfuricurvum sp. IAE1 TaxID=2546102 RepID=UPI00104CE14F|nr:cytochrome C [Sulfuricurvum sp. IAE1]MDD3770609.1 cytochrome C [Sulfuricurvum sp.]TDA64159.1 cytochrome C [Sulfuricurvum sp. IAE1]